MLLNSFAFISNCSSSESVWMICTKDSMSFVFIAETIWGYFILLQLRSHHWRSELPHIRSIMLESTDDTALAYPLHNHLIHRIVNNAVNLMSLNRDSSTLLYFPSRLSRKVRAKIGRA